MKRILILAVFIATHTFCILPVRAVEARNDSLEAIAAEAAPVDEAVAEAVAAAAITPGIELPDTYGLLVRTLLSLFAVVALIWGAVQLMKRLSPESTGGSGGQIRVLERAYLAPKRAVYVVQIGGKALALGVTDQQVTNLMELDLEETLSAYPRSSGSRSAAFASVFKSVKARFDGKQVAN